ncbi:hypothetical protein VNI00_000706 [Paramarasmius palmivorus]|uniref:Uncharacterized protein n=1 Tax=Paramarasmius palmivorus TaxID=297713 RepID=A0AAW0EBB5_9AGAR
MSCEDEGDYLDEDTDVDYEYAEVTDENELAQIQERYWQHVAEDKAAAAAQYEKSPGPSRASSSSTQWGAKRGPIDHSETDEKPKARPVFYKSPTFKEGSTRKQRANQVRTAKSRARRKEDAQNRDAAENLKRKTLEKAQKAEHAVVDFDVRDLPISAPGFIGLKEISSDKLPPLSKLKKFDWDGKYNRIWAVLGAGINDKSWQATIDGSTEAITAYHASAGLTGKDFENRRSGNKYGSVGCGASIGGGQRRPANIAIRRVRTRQAIEAFQMNNCIRRLVGHTGSLYRCFGYKLATESCDAICKVSRQFPDLKFPSFYEADRSCWAAFTINSATEGAGPQVSTLPHTDYGNYARSWCAVTALGRFDPDHGGHLIMWNVGITIRFPPGCTILFPSALITHSNVPVSPGETRYSLVQYTAGGLFRWVYNGGMSDKSFVASATKAELDRRDLERKRRAEEALRCYTTLEELMGGNYKGADLGSGSLAMESQGPPKRRKVT